MPRRVDAPESVADAGSRRLPVFSLAFRPRKLRRRKAQTPARRTSTSALMTVTKEPPRLMAAVLSGMPMQRTSRFSTQARDAWIASLEQEARCRLPYWLAARRDLYTFRLGWA